MPIDVISTATKIGLALLGHHSHSRHDDAPRRHATTVFIAQALGQRNADERDDLRLGKPMISRVSDDPRCGACSCDLTSGLTCRGSC